MARVERPGTLPQQVHMRHKITITVASIGGVVMTLASIPPSDALSNLGAWARLAGMHQVPGWLASPSADTWAQVIGATLVVASGLVFLIRWKRRQTRDTERKNAEPLPKPDTATLRANTLEPETPERIPFAAIRDLANEHGWKIVDRHTQSENRAYALVARLRQAAVDGTLRVWGRRHDIPLGTAPLVPINKEHFKEYEFEHGVLTYQLDNAQSRTGKLGSGLNELRGQVFCDLHVSERDVKRLLETLEPTDGFT